MRKLSSLCARSSNDYQIYLAYFHPNSWLDQGWTVEFIYYAFKLGFFYNIRHSSTFYRKQNFTLQHSRGKCNGNFHWIYLWFVKTPLGSATNCCICTGPLGHSALLVFPLAVMLTFCQITRKLYLRKGYNFYTVTAFMPLSLICWK